MTRNQHSKIVLFILNFVGCSTDGWSWYTMQGGGGGGGGGGARCYQYSDVTCSHYLQVYVHKSIALTILSVFTLYI